MAIYNFHQLIVVALGMRTLSPAILAPSKVLIQKYVESFCAMLVKCLSQIGEPSIIGPPEGFTACGKSFDR